MRRNLIITLVPLLLGLPQVSSLSIPKVNKNIKVAAVSMLKNNVDCNDDDYVTPMSSTSFSRRMFLLSQSCVAVVASSSGDAVYATMMNSETKGAQTFKAGEAIGVEEAKKRFTLARRDLSYLLDNYEEVSKGGGDAVRRYLGTVGVTSYMYGIGKVLKELTEEAEDLVEFTELSNEFNAYLYQADGAAYSSMFVEHSSAKGTPESFLKTAKGDAKMMKQYMDQLAAQLNL